MDLALAIFNVGAGLGVLAAGIGLAWLAIQAVPLLRETRALTADIRRVTVLVDQELRPILAHARELTGNVEVLSEDVAVKLDRLTDLMNSLQGSLDTVQFSATPRDAAPETPRYSDPPFWETEPRREADTPVESWHAREE
jgi:hypothetical protein